MLAALNFKIDIMQFVVTLNSLILKTIDRHYNATRATSTIAMYSTELMGNPPVTSILAAKVCSFVASLLLYKLDYKQFSQNISSFILISH